MSSHLVLLSCPLCGLGPPHIALVERGELMEPAEFEMFAVNCDGSRGGCGAVGGFHQTGEEAARAWNTRRLDPSAEEYEKWVEDAWVGKHRGHFRSQYDELKDLFVMCVGAAGEVGEVLEPIKKWIRDGKEMDKDELCLELGDVLHYVTRIARRFGLTLGEIMAANRAKIEHRQKYGRPPTVEDLARKLLAAGPGTEKFHEIREQLKEMLG